MLKALKNAGLYNLSEKEGKTNTRYRKTGAGKFSQVK